MGDEKMMEAFKYHFSRNRERCLLCGPRQGDRCNAVSCRAGLPAQESGWYFQQPMGKGVALEPSV